MFDKLFPSTQPYTCTRMSWNNHLLYMCHHLNMVLRRIHSSFHTEPGLKCEITTCANTMHLYHCLPCNPHRTIFWTFPTIRHNQRCCCLRCLRWVRLSIIVFNVINKRNCACVPILINFRTTIRPLKCALCGTVTISDPHKFICCVFKIRWRYSR